MPRLMSAAFSCPSVVPARIKLSQNLRLVRSVDDGEFEIEHLALALRAALEHAVLANTAGADMERHGRDRAVRESNRSHGDGASV